MRARISNGAFALRRALIVEPPCFPVAPVMRTARDAIVEEIGARYGRQCRCCKVEYVVFHSLHLYCSLYTCFVNANDFQVAAFASLRVGTVLLRLIGISVHSLFRRQRTRAPMLRELSVIQVRRNFLPFVKATLICHTSLDRFPHYFELLHDDTVARLEVTT